MTRSVESNPGAVAPASVDQPSVRRPQDSGDAVVPKSSDELVLLMNSGKVEVIAQAMNGELTVKDQAAYQSFRALKDLKGAVGP